MSDPRTWSLAGLLLIAGCAVGPGPEPRWGPKASAPLGDAEAPRAPAADAADLSTLVILAGDAGECEGEVEVARGGCLTQPEDPVTTSIRRELERADAGLLVWLGDNVYPNGLVEREGRQQTQQREVLKRQIDASGGKPVVFVAGNHDWNQRPGSKTGTERIENQREFVSSDPCGCATLVAGCPNQTQHRDIGASLRIVMYDSEWAVGGNADTHAQLIDALEAKVIAARATAARADGKRVVLASHHPLESVGEHARSRRRSAGGALLPALIKADMVDPRYARWRAALGGALDRWARPGSPLAGTVIALAGGHEHSLQILQRGGLTHLVSGSAVKLDPIFAQTPSDRIRYAASELGYLRIIERPSGEVAAEAVTVACGPSSPSCAAVEGPACEDPGHAWQACSAAQVILVPSSG